MKISISNCYLFNRAFDSDVHALFLNVDFFLVYRFRNFGLKKNCLILTEILTAFQGTIKDKLKI